MSRKGVRTLDDVRLGDAYDDCKGKSCLLEVALEGSLRCADGNLKGDYYFKFDAVTKEGERIYCLDVQIHFDYKDRDNWKDGGQIELK